MAGWDWQFVALLLGFAIGFLAERLVHRQQTAVAVQAAVGPLREENVRLTAQLEAQSQVFASQQNAWADAKRALIDSFQAISGEALRSNNQAFLDLAKKQLEAIQQRGSGELDQRRHAIESLLTPIRDSLQAFELQARGIERQRVEAYASLTEQVRQIASDLPLLRGETAKLAHALATPTVRGNWGELHLRRVVEMAGMLDHVDFVEQESGDGERPRRPDLVVHLPGATVVVDAKVPLKAYLEALDATDEATRKGRLAEHARQVREHIDQLSKRVYWQQFDHTPQFVVMFLPGEVFFSAALEADPELIERAVEQNVIVASPTTLIALLRAVAYGWRQERVADNAERVMEVGKELYARIAKFLAHLSGVGSGLGAAVNSYNDAVGSLEARLLPQARRFAEMGVVHDDMLEQPEPICVIPRVVRTSRADSILDAGQTTAETPA